MPREKSPTVVASKPAAPRKVVSLKSKVPAAPTTFVDPERRAAMIAEAAYYRAERRGFAAGDEIGDWLSAEQEVDAVLLRGDPPAARG